MSNESENKKDLSPEVNNVSDDKVEDEITSEDSQDDLKAKSVDEDEQDSTNDEEKATGDAKITTDKSNDISESKDKKENDLNSEDSEDVKGSTDEKENDNKDKKSDHTENGESEEEKETKTKVDEIPKRGRKANKVVEQPESKKRGNKSKALEEEVKDDKETSTEGKGMQLGEIPRVDASISRFKNDDLKLLYRLLFKAPGKSALIVKSIKKFNGFGFKKDTDEYTKKLESTKKFELKQLKSICEMLDLEKKGTKDEIVERIIDFLIEPKDSGKQAGGGRPKRTAAVRANNRGYSSHEDSYSSDERRASRVSARGKGKRTNLKDETTSESDEEFQLTDSSETSPPKKRSRPAPKHVSEDEDISEAENPSSDESNADSKKKKTNKKVVANDTPKPKPTPGRRGRKPAAETEKTTSTSKRPASRKQAVNEKNDAEKDENGSSSEDEPLIKKAKSPQPPTDEDIKKYVKEILDGANLEEITMKTVCKQVYAHYPDFDLAHKKDFIKTTVKSLIST